MSSINFYSFTFWSLTLEAENALDPEVNVTYSDFEGHLQVAEIRNIDGIDVSRELNAELPKIEKAMEADYSWQLAELRQASEESFSGSQYWDAQD